MALETTFDKATGITRDSRGTVLMNDATYAAMFNIGETSFDEATGLTRDSRGVIIGNDATMARMFSEERGYGAPLEQPQQPESPEEIYAGQFKAETKELDAQYNQARSSAEEAPKRAVQQLKEQMRIKWDAIANDRSLDAAGKTKKQDALETQFEVQSVAINGKAAPDLEKIEQVYQEEQRKMQAQFKAQADSDAQLVRLGQEGKIDPAEVQAERWSKALGRSIPASAFRGKAGNIEQRKNALEDDIRDIDRMLEGFTDSPVGFFKGAFTYAKRGQYRYEDPITEGMRNLDPRNKADAVIIAKFKELIVARREKASEFADLLIKNDPLLGPAAQKQKDWAAATAALAKNGAKGGGVKEGLIKAKGKPTSRISVISPNGTTGTIEISEWGQYQLQGFKRAE